MEVADRSTLKSFFTAGSVPFASDFEAIIDSGLNKSEDGIKKEATSALEVQAASPGSLNQDAILLYENFQDAAKWKISLKSQVSGSSTVPIGLSIGDGTKDSIFIEEGTGNVGINTITPNLNAELHVEGDILSTGLSSNNLSIINMISAGSDPLVSPTNSTPKLVIDDSKIIMRAGTLGEYIFHADATAADNKILLATYDGKSKSPQIQFKKGSELFNIGLNVTNDFVIESATAKPVLTLNKDGNIQIGEAGTTARLDVHGSLHLNLTNFANDDISSITSSDLAAKILDLENRIRILESPPPPPTT